MKKKILCAILTMVLFQPTISICAESNNFFNDSQISVGSANSLNQAVEKAINEMGLPNVTDALIASGAKNSYMHDIIITSESEGKFLAQCSYNQNTDDWSCGIIRNIDDPAIVYWIDEKKSSLSNVSYELVDYKTGDFIITDMCQEIIDDYIEEDNWPSVEDMYLYDSEGVRIEFPDDDDKLFSIIGTDDYPEAQTYRGIEIGDYAVLALSDFNPICYSFYVSTNDDSAESEALADEYLSQLETMDSSEYLSFITDIDYSRVQLSVGIDMAEIDGYLIPVSDDRVQNIFHRYNRGVEFSIKNGIIDNIYVEIAG